MKNVKKFIVKRTLATAAKALDFDGKSSWYYHSTDSASYAKHKNMRGLSFSKYNQVTNIGSHTIVAPLQDSLRDWLWDNYNISVTANYYEDGFGYLVKHVKDRHLRIIDYTSARKYSDNTRGNLKHVTYISAMEEGLMAAINYIKQI